MFFGIFFQGPGVSSSTRQTFGPSAKTTAGWGVSLGPPTRFINPRFELNQATHVVNGRCPVKRRAALVTY